MRSWDVENKNGMLDTIRPSHIYCLTNALATSSHLHRIFSHSLFYLPGFSDKDIGWVLIATEHYSTKLLTSITLLLEELHHIHHRGPLNRKHNSPLRRLLVIVFAEPIKAALRSVARALAWNAPVEGVPLQSTIVAPARRNRSRRGR